MGLVSKQCVDFVKEFEGFYPTPYYDIVGVKTLGYGMTGKEIEGLSSVTEAQASRMLENLLNNKYALPIKQDLDRRGVKLNQNQFDALVSMAYNIGTGGLLGSTLYRDVCNGVRDRERITNDFCMWCKAGGQTVYGLLRRRREEAAMFFGSGNTASTVEKEEKKKVKDIVIYNEGIDKNAAEYLGDFLSCSTIENSRPFHYNCVDNVYAVGCGKEGRTGYLDTLISGSNANNTLERVIDHILSKSGVKGSNNFTITEGEKKAKHKLVLYNNFTDKRAAEYLARNLDCPLKQNINIDATEYDVVYLVGGGEVPKGSNVKNIKGQDRFLTAKAVVDFMKLL
ncbi:glycoside hydrolase family protein [Acinetobacter baumannii]|nr:glycoside hydrolase family protein [Acinetobacter baumannii]